MVSEFDEHASDYAEAVNKSINFSGMNVEHFVAGKAAHLDSLLREKILSANDRVLDIGCGVGQYEALLGKKYNITGIDNSSSSIEHAQAAMPAGDFISYAGSKLPFNDDTFVCAFTICVVHHVSLEDRAEFIKEVHRVLKPGGIFLVYEHNPWNPLTRWAVERCVFDKQAILLSPLYARRWLGSNGFSSVSTEFLFTIPPVSDRLLRLDRITRRLPTGAQFVTSGYK